MGVGHLNSKKVTSTLKRHLIPPQKKSKSQKSQKSRKKSSKQLGLERGAEELWEVLGGSGYSTRTPKSHINPKKSHGWLHQPQKVTPTPKSHINPKKSKKGKKKPKFFFFFSP